MCVAILTICMLCRWLNFVNVFLCILSKKRNAKFNGPSVRQFNFETAIRFHSHHLPTDSISFTRICAVTNVITQIESNKKCHNKTKSSITLEMLFEQRKRIHPMHFTMRNANVCIWNAISSLNYEKIKLNHVYINNCYQLMNRRNNSSQRAQKKL